MMPSDERDQFLSELYTKYMDDLVRYCRAYVEYNTEYYDLILDVIQDTFLAANIEYEKLKNHPHIEGWLYKACRFRLTNAIKTYRRKKVTVQSSHPSTSARAVPLRSERQASKEETP